MMSDALTTAAVAGLTLYDMGKSVERAMVLDDVRLLEKRGGKSGTWRAPPSAASRSASPPVSVAPRRSRAKRR
jgi:hypothetical protein